MMSNDAAMLMIMSSNAAWMSSMASTSVNKPKTPPSPLDRAPASLDATVPAMDHARVANKEMWYRLHDMVRYAHAWRYDQEARKLEADETLNKPHRAARRWWLRCEVASQCRRDLKHLRYMYIKELMERFPRTRSMGVSAEKAAQRDRRVKEKWSFELRTRSLHSFGPIRGELTSRHPPRGWVPDCAPTPENPEGYPWVPAESKLRDGEAYDSDGNWVSDNNNNNNKAQTGGSTPLAARNTPFTRSMPPIPVRLTFGSTVTFVPNGSHLDTADLLQLEKVRADRAMARNFGEGKY